MAVDLALDDDNDIAFDGHDVMLIEGAMVTRQRLLVRLGTQEGQWFLDSTFGVPYFEYVFGANWEADQIVINSVFMSEILECPGVERLYGPLEFSFNNSTRNLSMTFQAIDESGEIIRFEVPGLTL